ncbi:PRD domain-containing protein [Alicyclobacillus dauci]|uniref:PRD domain-containing protein n=1 Tax=Alicyclobacillus dauci TaxID=1475485 RepID=A0ABY6Z0P9_9BACL|nr:PRD domain-containing protein [Alicyclobacillus dauci]WAH36163.1 PRD domain-containing protein [Alicyclobacillus dauci]
MDETLLERLEILVASGQIGDGVRQHVLETAGRFAQDNGVQLTENNAGSFVTHFAMACARIRRGEPVMDIPASVQDVADRHPDLVGVAKKMFPADLTAVTDAEVGFITMYLCVLLGKE